MVREAPTWMPFLVPRESTKNVAKRHNGMPIPVERVDIRSIFSPVECKMYFVQLWMLRL